MISKLSLKNFTAFKEISIDFSSGINVLIGQNSTGKTHIMKLLYASCYASQRQPRLTLEQKLNSVFLPNSIGRLVHRSVGRGKAEVSVSTEDNHQLEFEITTLGKFRINAQNWERDNYIMPVYIPVKDMLANAPGFRSLYASRNINFEEIYSDIIDLAFMPIPKGKPSKERAKLMNILRKQLDGRVVANDETFYLKNKSGSLEFPLLAEGFRKLGLLYLLIQNETLRQGSVVFWDEPEANLNPKLSLCVAEMLLALQAMGVQVFVATHDYSFIKSLSLVQKHRSKVLYHSLYKDEEGDLLCSSSPDIVEIEHNAIELAYEDLLVRSLKL